MRIIPKRTKVSTEFFRGLSFTDILVGFFAVLVMFLVFISSLPGKLWIELVLFFLFGLLLARIDDEPNYMYLVQIIRHFSYFRHYGKLPEDGSKRKAKQEKRAKAPKKEKKRRGFLPKTDKKAAGESDDAEAEAIEEAPAAEASPETKGETDAAPTEEVPAEEVGRRQAVSRAEKKQAKAELKAAEKAKKRQTKQAAKARKAEDKFLKNKKVPESEKEAIRERRRKEAEEAYLKQQLAKQARERIDISKLTLVRDIRDGYINYSGQYYGAAIEIPPVEFRFFSEYRKENAIDRGLGSVIRAVGAKYAANIIKIERPMMLDDHIDGEYDKLDALRQSYERGVFTEEELKARIEVVYDRINNLRYRNLDDKVLVPHYYLVLFDSDKRQLDNQIRTAMMLLTQGEMKPKRLNDKELAVFLKYTNSVDFDEREIENIDPDDYARFAMPESVEIKQRTVQVNGIITHNFRVNNYPLLVDNAWGASLFDMPGTKVVMKFSQMDREKSIKAIDRSISELTGQLERTGISSKVLELQTHIETLSELLVMLQNNNENLMAMNMYITGYDIASTRDNKLLVPQPEASVLPRISSMKKEIKRTFNEQGFKVHDMSFQQFQAYVATQVNGYDPFAKKARGVPGSTVAAVFPWIYASLSDKKGLNLGSSEGVPTFIDFFRRDSERVNSNMVIVGKSGGGKSYATKSILTNLAADDAKIFVLDPENEYAELAANLNGKFINVANSSHGRINPFHIITSLEDDEAEDGQETSSYAAHLQFLEEFFRQILPDIDGDAIEYLNNLINRVYSQKNIDQYTNLSLLKPEDYPIFDDLYDCILEEFQRTKSDYLKSNLRVLMNYIAKFSTGGRNANIWNGPSTLSTVENFIVFNFQMLLANRNNMVANAQMLLVMKYLDNEIIKNREYNMKYGAKRKIIIVIDEAHVFIDAKYPLALDFMFQLAKRIRKYNGMQIVITQNIKDFVGSEELARKSTAIINACQYSYIFSLAPNDMHDLCTLYEKAGGINEVEQEQIISAARGQAFVVTGPTSRATMQIETPPTIEEMFSMPHYETHYFAGAEGEQNWDEALAESRVARAQWEAQQQAAAAVGTPWEDEDLPNFRQSGIDFIEVEEDEEEVVLLMEEEPVAASLPKHMQQQAILVEEEDDEPDTGGAFSPKALQKYGFEALVQEIRRSVQEEVQTKLGGEFPVASTPAVPAAMEQPAVAAFASVSSAPAADVPEIPVAEDLFGGDLFGVPDRTDDLFGGLFTDMPTTDDLFGDMFAPLSEEEAQRRGEEVDAFAALFDVSAAPEPQAVVDDWFAPPTASGTDTRETTLEDLFRGDLDETGALWQVPSDEELPPLPTDFGDEPVQQSAPAELPLVYEVTLEQLMAMED